MVLQEKGLEVIKWLSAVADISEIDGNYGKAEMAKQTIEVIKYLNGRIKELEKK